MNSTENTPSYKRITGELLKRIHNGLYPPKSFLPSENQLADEFGVTRTTIRKILDHLRHQGTIESFQGKGYKVRPLFWEQSLLQFYSFGRNIGNELGNSKTDVIDLALLAGSKAKSAMGFGVRSSMVSGAVSGVGSDPAGSTDQVWEITRLRLVADTPLILETSYIPKQYLPDVEKSQLAQHSLYDLLAENGIHIVRAKENLAPVLPSKEAQRLLSVPGDSPLFETNRQTFDTKRRLVEVRKSLIRGDIFRFSVEMTV